MLKEITLKQAMERYERGDRDILVLVAPEGTSAWEDYCPTMLSSVFERMRFLVDEAPDTVACPDPETLKEEKPRPLVPAERIIKALETAVETQEDKNDTVPEQEPEHGKRKDRRIKLDEGKIRSLHNAGWSNSKIADYLGVTDVTIGKRIKEMKERGEL